MEAAAFSAVLKVIISIGLQALEVCLRKQDEYENGKDDLAEARFETERLWEAHQKMLIEVHDHQVLYLAPSQ